MNTYKQIQSPFDQTIASIQRLTDNAYIPFDPANTDYQQFKIDVTGGAELQDPEGVPMTQEQADAFLETLP